MADTNELRFPSNFTFGVATAAYQVEGHIENDWSEWERAGKCKNPEHRCGRSVDHWNRFDEDVRLAKDVGCGAFRLSLEWARIEPVRGRFDENAIAEYRARLQRMKAAGVQPMVTLHHFTHPQWFHKETPWHSPESVAAFRRYAKVCGEIVKGLDARIVTFNEPMVLLLGGYIQGCIPPGIADGRKAMAALGNIGRSHVAAREEITQICGKTEFGISQNVLVFAPDRAWHPLDRAITRLAQDNYNHAFIRALSEGSLNIFMPGLATTKQKLDGARDSLDFVGVNYYTRAHLRFIPKPPFIQFNYRDVHGRGLTHIGWEDFPEGFLQMLMEVKSHHGLPMWVTENGIDDRDGNRRPSYLHSHWKQVLEAINRGADLRGYLYWSLMDNFEWLDGWGPRFGLYHVDFETLERKRTPGADYFKKVAESRVLSTPEVKFELAQAG